MTDAIVEMEEALRRAMLAGDAEALDRLLADDTVFTDQNGGRMGKQEDLAAHRSGLLRLTNVDVSEQEIRMFGDVAVVTLTAALAGSYGGEGFAGRFAYTRVWARAGDSWRVAAAHCSPSLAG